MIKFYAFRTTWILFFLFKAKFLPYSNDCHIVTCARDGQVRLGELSSSGECKGTRKLGQHKAAAHKVIKI